MEGLTIKYNEPAEVDEDVQGGSTVIVRTNTSVTIEDGDPDALAGLVRSWIEDEGEEVEVSCKRKQPK